LGPPPIKISGYASALHYNLVILKYQYKYC